MVPRKSARLRRFTRVSSWRSMSSPISRTIPACRSLRSAPRSSCAWVRRRRSTTRTSSSTWATTARSSAPTARPCTNSIRRSTRIRRGRRHAPCPPSTPPDRSFTSLTQARHVIVAGAGIAGLTAALTMAKAGLRVTLLEQADRLLETGAGLQLSPNATRVLTSLGLRERLLPHAVAPHAIRVMSGGSGREIVRIPLADAEKKYGAPFWVLHRADLQAALVAAAQASMDITLKLGTRVEDFAAHVKGVSVLGRQDRQVFDERGMVLIGADGIW